VSADRGGHEYAHGHEHEHGGAAVPWSPVPFEAYGVRVRVQAGEAGLEPADILAALLQETANACLAAGAPIIGHLKCMLRNGSRRLRCSLTSVERGAVCEGDGTTPLAAGGMAELDLAVLVYGLRAVDIDPLVRRALEDVLAPVGACWRLDG